MDFVLLLERYSLLGVRKDYWNFITDCIPRDDGVKYVQAIPQVKKHHFLLSLKISVIITLINVLLHRKTLYRVMHEYLS